MIVYIVFHADNEDRYIRGVFWSAEQASLARAAVACLLEHTHRDEEGDEVEAGECLDADAHDETCCAIEQWEVDGPQMAVR